MASESRGFSRADLIGFGVAAIACLVALALRQAGAEGYVVFIAAAVSVMALAYVLGEATEQAGTASGPRLASLLNATFGNLPELIIVVLTIREGLVDVARASIIGSVIGNILLVLGASILLGGLRNGAMRFDQRSVGVNASMLVIVAVALGVPSLFGHLDGTTRHEQATLPLLGGAGLSPGASQFGGAEALLDAGQMVVQDGDDDSSIAGPIPRRRRKAGFCQRN